MPQDYSEQVGNSYLLFTAQVLPHTLLAKRNSAEKRRLLAVLE